MSASLLPLDALLRDASRRPIVPVGDTQPASAGEVALLLGCGAAAACAVTLLEFNLRLPGHAILRALFPMAGGLALVPRRGAGTIMGLGAMLTAGTVLGAGWGERGLGSLTSLFLLGPALDAALALARSAGKRGIYAAIVGAALAANGAAFAMQLLAKFMHWDAGGGKRIAAWVPLAAITYPAFGILAGLVCAAIWFRRRAAHEPE